MSMSVEAAATSPKLGSCEAPGLLGGDDFLDGGSHTRLTVYDGLGRRVWGLLSRSMTAGSHTVSWDGRDESGGQVGSGRYLIRMEARSDQSYLDAGAGQSRDLVFVEAVTLLQ